MSSWLAWVVMRGHPTSRISSSRSSSRSDSSASCSWERQRARSSRSVDQLVSSKARRAASMARPISALDASATWPRTSSVAGLTLSNVRPESEPMSSPSTSILDSCSAAVVTAPSLPGLSAAGNRVIKKCDKHNRGGHRPLLPAPPPVRAASHHPDCAQSGKAGGSVAGVEDLAPPEAAGSGSVPAPSSWSSTSVRRTKWWKGCSAVKPMPASTCWQWRATRRALAAGEGLGHGAVCAGVLPRRVEQRSRRLDRHQRIGEAVTDGLEAADGAPELHPVERVLAGQLEHGACRAHELVAERELSERHCRRSTGPAVPGRCSAASTSPVTSTSPSAGSSPAT